MNAYNVDSGWMVRVIILVLLGMQLGNAAMAMPQVQGVVNSSITIRCLIPPDFDTETVIWSVNSSAIPFLTYFLRDNTISPLNHDPRFSITDPEELEISHVMKSDSGIYECRLTSRLPLDDLVSTISVSVKDGCTMLSYNPPLATTSNGYLSGGILPYAQHCYFTCDEGFWLVGNDSTQCLGNGELSSQTPHCEEITCQIGDLPPHLTDNNRTCIKDAQVSYGVTCHFVCTTGYSLTGNGTIRITCDREQVLDDPHFPECEVISEESSRLSGGYIALLCIFLLLIVAVALGIFLWILRGSKNKGKDDHVKGGGKEIIPLVITTFSGFMDYLRQQIGETHPEHPAAAIGTILKKLERVELQNIPKLDRMKFRENDTRGVSSFTDAFVWYVAEIIRCIGKSNPTAAVDLMTDILSFTEEIESGGTKTAASIGSLKTEDDDGTKTYFEVVHYAFENLLIVMQNSTSDQDAVRERTTNVSIMMKNYLKKNKHKMKDCVLVSEITKPNWVSDGASFFARMCLQNVGRCVDVIDRIIMRYNIIRIMINQADGTNKNDQEKQTS